jgi:hypothetical protein
MKKYYFLFLLLISFESFSIVTFNSLNTSGCYVFHLKKDLIGKKFATFQKADDYYTSLDWPSSCTDSRGQYSDFGLSSVGDFKTRYTRGASGITVSAGLYGSEGCNFNECKELATEECARDDTTLNEQEYKYRSSGDYDSSCNPPPPDEPIQSNEECETLSYNQCNTRGSVSNFTFVDNGDFTYECDYTCGDGTTGDKNGALAKDSDGICDPNDPNDLSDCDVSDNQDPNCVSGCGDAYTPDNSNNIEYTADGTNQSDGTGTDNLTNIQGDVLINEIVKLKNENAVQTIKTKNAVVSAVEGIDSNSKLDQVIIAINNSGGGGSQSTDLSSVTSSLDGIKNSIGSTTVTKINGPTDSAVSFWVSDYPDGVRSVWNDSKDAFENTEYVQFLSTFNPNLTAGVAADMQFCFNLGAMGNFGCHALPVDSSIWSAIRIFILVSAGFLCRRIIFGG